MSQASLSSQPPPDRSAVPRDDSALSRGDRLSTEISKIIDRGRPRPIPRAGKLRAVSLTAGASLVMLWAAFTPLDIGPLAWIALVPMSLLLRPVAVPRLTYRTLAGLGMLWAGVTLQWMRLGHPAMYIALAAMAFYIGLYIPAFVGLGRSLRKAGLPLWVSVPVAWTALDYLRAWLFTGFEWYYIGHTQYRWISIIQITDITGVWGLTFLIALCNAALAEWIPDSWLARLGFAAAPEPPQASESDAAEEPPQPGADLADSERTPARTDAIRPPWWATATAVGGFAAALGYGLYRAEAPEDFPAGPNVALIQGNYPPDIKADSQYYQEMLQTHDLLTRYAIGFGPELIVWPETAFPVPWREVDEDVSDQKLVASLPEPEVPAGQREAIVSDWRRQSLKEPLETRAAESGATIVFGLPTHRITTDGPRSFNSAICVRPDHGVNGHYDKQHRVIFGEYVPLASVFPWLAQLTPYGTGSGIEAGTESTVFSVGDYTACPMICFEDTVSSLVREAVVAGTADQAPDLIVNLTNDGWFRGSSELDQHLITAVFRSVENRIPTVRAVNTGISAIIDGDGRIREPAEILELIPATGNELNISRQTRRLKGMRDPETGQRRRNFDGVIFGEVPLDPRSSLYQSWGDWFAWCCSFTALVGLVASRRRR